MGATRIDLSATEQWLMVSKNDLIRELMAQNEMTERFGLVLTLRDAEELVQDRERILKDHGRVEIGSGILTGLIEHFAPSPYVRQPEYVQILSDLLDIFHGIKNEVEDDLEDEALLEVMAQLYNSVCGGDVELLGGLYADRLVALYREGRWTLDKEDLLIQDDDQSDEEDLEGQDAAEDDPGEGDLWKKI